MEKIHAAERRQQYSIRKKLIPAAVFITCYAWFAWQLYLSPWYITAIVAGMTAFALAIAFARSRSRIFPIAGRHETP